MPARTTSSGEVASQDVVARVAAVVAELDVDVVAPRLTESVPREVGLPVPAFDRQVVQQGSRVVVAGVATEVASVAAGRRPVLPVPPCDDGDHEGDQSDQRGNDSGPAGAGMVKPT